jgi:tryptophan synthase alpha chain
MTNLEKTLLNLKQQNRLGLMTHVVVGYPDLEGTYELVKTMVEEGVDVIELQIPFSDPMADGSTIMAASEQALSLGVTPQDCLDFMKRVSADFAIPFVFMSYFNIVFSFGTGEFVRKAKSAGASGFIIPDALPDTKEGKELYDFSLDAQVPMITVLAPQNEPERVAELEVVLKTLVYQPLHKGVTGARSETNQLLQKEINLIRQHTDAAIAVGFGVSKPEHVLLAKESGADVVVVGSAVIDTFNDGKIEAVRKFLKSLREVL